MASSKQVKALIGSIAVMAIAWAGIPLPAQADTVSLDENFVIDDEVLGWNTSGWDRSKLVTVGDYQYTAYWDADFCLAVARRDVTASPVVVQTIKFDTDPQDCLPDTPYGEETQRSNSHRSISIGVSRDDGRLHLSFNHHADAMKYKVSDAAFTSTPPGTITTAMFSATTSITGTLDEVTYPRFINGPNDDFYFSFRNGWSAGDADNHLFKYDSTTGAWAPVGNTGMVISRAGLVAAPAGQPGVYDHLCASQRSQGGAPPVDDPTDLDNSYCRSAYEHDLVFDGNGTIHMTWTWREQYNDRSVDHGLYYAYSEDNGLTWLNNAGVQVADLANDDPIDVTDPGLVAVSAPQGSWIINNGGLALDSNNQPHVMTARSTTLTAVEADTDMKYIHYWRDTLGAWHSAYMESSSEEFPSWRARGDIAIDGADNIYAYGIFRGALYLYQATASDGWATWSLYSITDSFVAGDGLKFDPDRWRDSGILSIPVLDNSDPTRTAFVVSEFQVGATIAPSAPTQLVPVREPGSITVRWANQKYATEFNVYRKADFESSFTQIATVPTSSLQWRYADTSVSNGVGYSYVISAENSAGESGTSREQFSGVCASGELAARWMVDEIVERVLSDYTCNANDANIVGYPGWPRGVARYAMSGAQANAADNSTLDGMASVSVSAWVKLSKLPAGGTNYVIVGKDSTTAQASYRLTVNGSGTGHFVVGTTGNAMYSTGTQANFTTALTPGTWYHMVGTFDGSRTRVYVNGVLEGTGSTTLTGSIVAGTSPVAIAGSAATSASLVPLRGTIDDVRIYNRALSPVDITAIGDPDLVAYWNLNELNGSTMVTDMSTDGSHSGELRGGSSWTGGIRRNAVSLDGTNDYIAIADSPQLTGHAAMTVSAWVRLDALPASGEVFDVVGKDATGAEASYRLAVNSTGGGHFVVSTTNDYWYTAGTKVDIPSGITTGAWHHLVGTYDGAHVRVYLNGALVGTGSEAISGAIVDGTSPLHIGSGSLTGTDYLDGRVDDVRIYRKSLDGPAISTLNALYY